AIAAAYLMTALTSANARSTEAGLRERALRQAEALLSEALASSHPTDLSHHGDATSASFSWTRQFLSAGERFPGLQRVVVDVSWRPNDEKGVTHLEAYRIVSPK